MPTLAVYSKAKERNMQVKGTLQQGQVLKNIHKPFEKKKINMGKIQY